MPESSPAGRLHLSDPPLRVVLVEPQIPPNTGNVARLCAATRCHLVLLGELGFELDNASLRRAGLDYWDFVSWEHQRDVHGYLGTLAAHSFHLLSARAEQPIAHMPVARGDALIFGKETVGLPAALLERYPGQCYTVPMAEPRVRSLNLASAVAIVLSDALRRMERA